MLLGVIDPHVNPEEIFAVNETVPVIPPTDTTVMVETADWPTFKAAGELAVMVNC
jgi:hypothetical protein